MSHGPTVDLIQAADILKVHPKTVQDYIAAGALPAAKVGRAWVMMTTDVIDLVAQLVAQQTADRMRGRGRATRAARPGPSRAGSRSASSSGGSCAR